VIPKAARSLAVAFSIWLPFCVLWVLFALSLTREPLSRILVNSLISMGSAGLLGIAVWHVCRRLRWPLRFSPKFYVLQILLALAYAAVWLVAVYVLESVLRRGSAQNTWSWPAFLRALLFGFWYYAVFAGISYAVQTRTYLHEQEMVAARAEALVTAARLDALRARLNPHFLFNALHTLAALVKFRPGTAEDAIERLGDMLRYALKEDGRSLVEFSEEYDFTRQYLAFEQLRYEDRLRVDLHIDPESFNFDLPPFSIQTLAENAVRHAIAIRPDGGSLWIKCSCSDGRLRVTVRDDGAGDASEASESHHQFGLRSLKERLRAAYGASAELQVLRDTAGFQASFVVPDSPDLSSTKHKRDGVRT
jgi:signal transduction histidine kinase